MHARLTRRNSIRLAASLAVVATVAATGITPASAATASVPFYYSGDDCGISASSFYAGQTCAGGLLLFYHANGNGAAASIVGGIDNLSDAATYGYVGSTLELLYYTDYVFWGMASANNDGEGQGIRNNAASVSNQSSSHSYTVYVSPGYTGHAQTFGPNDYYANLNSQLVNNEASVIEN